MKNVITLIDTILHEMETDDITRLKQDFHLIEAYKNKDIDAFLIALCGWSFETLVDINRSNRGTMLNKLNKKLLKTITGA